MTAAGWQVAAAEQTRSGVRLEEGARVGVVGGGPAGAFFAYFLLDFADRVGLELAVDILEPRDFAKPAPLGCNMCGGIVSESLVQVLAAEGIMLPARVIQRGIDAYVLHTEESRVRIETPLHEKRIGAVHRGGGPRDIKEAKWGSFDEFLLRRAEEKGARIVRGRVDEMGWRDGRPTVRRRKGEAKEYDLVAVAAGVNATLKLFEGWTADFHPPETTKTFIREYYIGEERIGETLGNSMHVFLLDLPRLEFAAIIPKGDYVTVCMLGDDVDQELVSSFFAVPEVRQCFPAEWSLEGRSCQCGPRINVGGAVRPYADRVVFVGDCAITRLYKDGIGAAYRTAKAAARTAVFDGISADSFRDHYEPVCRAIARDNAIGRFTFGVSRVIQGRRLLRRAVVRMTAGEQHRPGPSRRMSRVLWDLFTGSASYREVLLCTLHPAFWLRFAWSIGRSAFARGRAPDE